MPGNRNSGTTEPSSPFFLYDESLAPEIGRVLAHVGFSLEVGEKGKLDEVLIPEMGGKRQTWITKDDRARVQHEDLILKAGISIVFMRGLSHHEKWLRKSEQGDKWNRCLIEGMIVLSETGARDEQTTPP